MTLNNLSRVTTNKIDGNTLPEQGIPGPAILVVGTASKGRADQAYLMTTASAAKAEFGTTGTLLRGMYEALQSGAENVILYRIGGTSAKVTGIGDSGGTGGYTVETISKDDTSGTDYSMYYDDSENRVVVRRNSDDLVVFDNSLDAPIELFEVVVSGTRATGGGEDIGSASGFVDLADVSATGTVYTAGTDGIDLSRMELYEKLYVAYKDLLSYSFDVTVPMDVFLDDYNVIDQGHYLGAITPVLPGTNTYPTAGAYTLGSNVDALGRVYVEEYEGNYYFWWDLTADSFTAASIYPTSVGSATATTKIDGTDLSDDDFHEVNFAYQLGRFLYDYSTDIVDATGVIGCLPPASLSLTDKARWLGKAPTYTLNSTTGTYYIASSSANGTGLLGNKFMAGRSDWRSGEFGGGMILTDTEFMDGTEQEDTNEVPIDLGKYISVAAETVYMRNSWYTNGYGDSFAASYGGQYLNLAPNSAPTNKKVSATINKMYTFKLGDLDSLAGTGYVVLRNKPQGLVIADAPMATLPNSDWKRLSTGRIVKQIIDGVRTSCDKYLGGLTPPGTIAAMKEAVTKVLQRAVSNGLIKRYDDFEIIQTPDMAVAGEATIDLNVVPAFELRVLTLNISLAKA